MRVQSDHWAILLDFCELHPEIITNRFTSSSNGRKDINELWSQLSLSLNSIGLGEKSIEEWKKTLTDWKSKTKAKAGGLGSYQKKTGGGGPSSVTISSFEERLLKLMGKVAIEGNAAIREIGLKKRKNVDIAMCHTQNKIPATVVSNTSTNVSSCNIFSTMVPLDIPDDNITNSTIILNPQSIGDENMNIHSSVDASIVTTHSALINNDHVTQNLQVNPFYNNVTAKANLNIGSQPATKNTQPKIINSSSMSPVGIHTIFQKPVRIEATETSNSRATASKGRFKMHRSKSSSMEEIKCMNEEVLGVLKNINENIYNLNATLREFLPIINK